jgi:hypothetical protein
MFEDDKDEEQMDFRELPLYRKGKEILDVVSQIGALLPEDDEYLQQINAFMMEDASQLVVKVAGAQGMGLYDLKMESAAIIRKAARDLIVHQHSLQTFGFKEAHYFQIVRELVEEYRLLFIDWVAGFDPWDYVIDRWGLFNPPGVGPFDKDPDDDIPFHNPFKDDFPPDDDD